MKTFKTFIIDPAKRELVFKAARSVDPRLGNVAQNPILLGEAELNTEADLIDAIATDFLTRLEAYRNLFYSAVRTPTDKELDDVIPF